MERVMCIAEPQCPDWDLLAGQNQQVHGSDIPLVRTLLEYCDQLWASSSRADTDPLVQIQGTGARLVRRQEHVTYKEKLRDLSNVQP